MMERSSGIGETEITAFVIIVAAVWVVVLALTATGLR
jgi:hypothetical protein